MAKLLTLYEVLPQLEPKEVIGEWGKKILKDVERKNTFCASIDRTLKIQCEWPKNGLKKNFLTLRTTS